MLKLIDKKITTILCSKLLFISTYDREQLLFSQTSGQHKIIADSFSMQPLPMTNASFSSPCELYQGGRPDVYTVLNPAWYTLPDFWFPPAVLVVRAFFLPPAFVGLGGYFGEIFAVFFVGDGICTVNFKASGSVNGSPIKSSPLPLT